MADTIAARTGYDVEAVRRDFPILSREVYGKPLVFLDSAASAMKPRQVVDTIRDVYENDYPTESETIIEPVLRNQVTILLNLLL